MLTERERLNLETIDAFWRSIEDPATRDLNAFEPLFHDEHVWTSDTVRFDKATCRYTITGERLELKGPRLARTLMEMYIAAFPDLTFDEVASIAQGDRVASEWHATGTHQGDFMGIGPTGRRGDVRGASFYTLKDGRILKSDVYWDVSVLLREMGWEGWSGPSPSPTLVPSSVGARISSIPPLYQNEVEAILARVGGPFLLPSSSPDSPLIGESLEEVKQMSNLPRWVRSLSVYRVSERRVLKCRSRKDLELAVHLCWNDEELRGVPRDWVPDRLSLVVPAEAVPLFKAKGVRFTVSTLIDPAELTPERRAELRRRNGI